MCDEVEALIREKLLAPKTGEPVLPTEVEAVSARGEDEPEQLEMDTGFDEDEI